LTTLLVLPIGNGILTVDTEAQAKDRLGGAHGHKGADAARAALAMVKLKRELAGA
jgi:6,7-dimethyl-8-ribityllumazine synthase